VANGFTGKVHHVDARVGGTYKMSFTNFTTGRSHTFGDQYLELTPYERIRYTDRFEDPNMPGEIQVTITLKKVSCGTELNVVQAGVPEVIPPGWGTNYPLLILLLLLIGRISVAAKLGTYDRFGFPSDLCYYGATFYVWALTTKLIEMINSRSCSSAHKASRTAPASSPPRALAPLLLRITTLAQFAFVRNNPRNRSPLPER
jgi:hypothetical protein